MNSTTNRTNCQHTEQILVKTDGLGGWNVTETYRCKECGALEVVKVNTSEDSDLDWEDA